MRQKKLDRYPVEFWKIVTLTTTSGLHEIEVDSPSAARSLRDNFYQFRKTLKEALAASPDDDALLITAARAARISVSLREHKVIFYAPAIRSRFGDEVSDLG